MAQWENHLLSMGKALGLIPSTERGKKGMSTNICRLKTDIVWSFLFISQWYKIIDNLVFSVLFFLACQDSYYAV